MSGRARRTLLRPSAPPAGAPRAAVQVGDLLFAGGDASAAREGAVPPSGRLEPEVRAAFEALSELLAKAGGTMGDVVELTSLHADSRTIEAAFEIGREYLEGGFPAWTPVSVTAQREPGTLFALSAVAHLGQSEKRCIVPDTISWWRRHPTAAGCLKGELLFVAGQYGSDTDGNVNTPGDHGGQARNALNRVAEICRLAGASLDDVVAVHSTHQDPRWIPTVSAVYESEFFDRGAGPSFPAWTATGSPGMLRSGMLGQYAALVDTRGDGRTAFTPDRLGWREEHRSAATGKEGNGLLAASAVAPNDAGGGVAFRGDPEAQAQATLEVLDEALAGLGASLRDVVQLVSFHLDPAALEGAERVFGEAMDGVPCVWTAGGMTGGREEGQLHAVRALALR